MALASVLREDQSVDENCHGSLLLLDVSKLRSPGRRGKVSGRDLTEGGRCTHCYSGFPAALRALRHPAVPEPRPLQQRAGGARMRKHPTQLLQRRSCGQQLRVTSFFRQGLKRSENHHVLLPGTLEWRGNSRSKLNFSFQDKTRKLRSQMGRNWRHGSFRFPMRDPRQFICAPYASDPSVT